MSDNYYVYDKYIDDPTPYKALDGSYHATMEEVEAVNEKYWAKVMNSIAFPNKDILLTSTQLEQIRLNPSFASLVSVLHQIMQQQLKENDEKSMHK